MDDSEPPGTQHLIVKDGDAPEIHDPKAGDDEFLIPEPDVRRLTEPMSLAAISACDEVLRR